jgi:lysophospholipase L1-like esterase
VRLIFTHIAFWLCLPLSAAQGLWLRRTAKRLPEATGKRIGVVGQGKQLQLLALGDSIIAGVGTVTIENSFPVQFARALAGSRNCEVNWQVAGENGADIARLRQLASRFDKSQRADVILISIGVNDVTGLSSKRHWTSQLQGLLRDLECRWPTAHVILLGLPPMSRFPLLSNPLRFALGFRASVFDTIAARLVTGQANVVHVPTGTDPIHHEFCDDGFHPSAKVCELWAEVLAQNLKSDTLNI